MKKINKLIVIIVMFSLCFALSSLSSFKQSFQPVKASTTATIVANPSSGTYAIGATFNVTLVINGGGQSFNAASATVSVTDLTINSVTDGNCGFTYVQTATTSNPSFAGGIFGSSSNNCTVYTLSVTTSAAGTASVNISAGSVKASDGNGTEIFSSSTSSSYTVTLPTPVMTTTPPTTTYNSTIALTGTKDTHVTTVYINASSTGITYPDSTHWSLASFALAVGSDTIAIYGKDASNNTSATSGTVTIARHKLGDINGDTNISLPDFSIFALDWLHSGGAILNSLSDMNGDGSVNLQDLSVFASNWGH